MLKITAASTIPFDAPHYSVSTNQEKRPAVWCLVSEFCIGFRVDRSEHNITTLPARSFAAA